MPRGVPRVPEPWEWIKTKRCSVCKEVKPWAKFSPKRYWPDGSVRSIVSRCHKCASLAANKPKTGERLERKRQLSRQWYKKRKLELQADRNGYGPLLPLEPFLSWILERKEEVGNWTTLSAITGVPERGFNRITTTSQGVSLDVVDRCYRAFGENVNDHYPPEQEEERAA